MLNTSRVLKFKEIGRTVKMTYFSRTTVFSKSKKLKKPTNYCNKKKLFILTNI